MSLARQIVNFAIQAGSSDIHLEEGSPIAIRVNSDIRILENVLGPNDMSRLLSEIVSEDKIEQYNRTGDLDTSIGLEGLSRIRINAYKANEKRCLTLRILPDNLPKWQDLGLPQPFIDLTEKHRPGPAPANGLRKSTTWQPLSAASEHKSATSSPSKIRSNLNSSIQKTRSFINARSKETRKHSPQHSVLRYGKTQM